MRMMIANPPKNTAGMRTDVGRDVGEGKEDKYGEVVFIVRRLLRLTRASS